MKKAKKKSLFLGAVVSWGIPLMTVATPLFGQDASVNSIPPLVQACRESIQPIAEQNFREYVLPQMRSAQSPVVGLVREFQNSQSQDLLRMSRTLNAATRHSLEEVTAGRIHLGRDLPDSQFALMRPILRGLRGYNVPATTPPARDTRTWHFHEGTGQLEICTRRQYVESLDVVLDGAAVTRNHDMRLCSTLDLRTALPTRTQDQAALVHQNLTITLGGIEVVVRDGNYDVSRQEFVRNFLESRCPAPNPQAQVGERPTRAQSNSSVTEDLQAASNREGAAPTPTPANPAQPAGGAEAGAPAAGAGDDNGNANAIPAPGGGAEPSPGSGAAASGSTAVVAVIPGVVIPQPPNSVDFRPIGAPAPGQQPAQPPLRPTFTPAGGGAAQPQAPAALQAPQPPRLSAEEISAERASREAQAAAAEAERRLAAATQTLNQAAGQNNPPPQSAQVTSDERLQQLPRLMCLQFQQAIHTAEQRPNNAAAIARARANYASLRQTWGGQDRQTCDQILAAQPAPAPVAPPSPDAPAPAQVPTPDQSNSSNGGIQMQSGSPTAGLGTIGGAGGSPGDIGSGNAPNPGAPRVPAGGAGSPPSAAAPPAENSQDAVQQRFRRLYLENRNESGTSRRSVLIECWNRVINPRSESNQFGLDLPHGISVPMTISILTSHGLSRRFDVTLRPEANTDLPHRSEIAIQMRACMLSQIPLETTSTEIADEDSNIQFDVTVRRQAAAPASPPASH